MSTAPLYTDDLLDPLSSDQPVGADMRWTPEWDRIKEARRADDDLVSGKWEKRERKVADWLLVEDLAARMLRERSKDLQLALWLTEAGIKLHGFAGLRDGLRTVRELMVRYWDKGVYPAMEDGPEDRAGPFEWLNNKLVDSITVVPITARADHGRDYSFVDLQDARRTGSEKNFRVDGEIDAKRKKAYEQALADGRISMEMFDQAVDATRRADYEELSADFQQSVDEFKALEKVIEEKFGEAAPNLAACRNGLSEIRQAVSDILQKKREAEPDKAQAQAVSPPAVEISGQAPPAAAVSSPGIPLSLPDRHESQPVAKGSWREAEMLIRSGHVDRGLAEMTRLVASETSGRNRFQRKLLLAEVCLGTKRERLARSILEELAEQIDKFQLELWESSELICNVWTRLYKLYKQGTEKSDLDRAGKLYERLCRLDPWQALSCSSE